MRALQCEIQDRGQGAEDAHFGIATCWTCRNLDALDQAAQDVGRLRLGVFVLMRDCKANRPCNSSLLFKLASSHFIQPITECLDDFVFAVHQILRRGIVTLMHITDKS